MEAQAADALDLPACMDPQRLHRLLGAPLVFFPLAFVNMIPIFTPLRLALPYQAPKRLKGEAMTYSG